MHVKVRHEGGTSNRNDLAALSMSDLCEFYVKRSCSVPGKTNRSLAFPTRLKLVDKNDGILQVMIAKGRGAA